jgi:hypothetical protein
MSLINQSIAVFKCFQVPSAGLGGKLKVNVVIFKSFLSTYDGTLWNCSKLALIMSPEKALLSWFLYCSLATTNIRSWVQTILHPGLLDPALKDPANVLIHVLLYLGRMVTFLSDHLHLSCNAECPTSSSHCRSTHSLLHSEWSSPAALDEKCFPVITWWSSSGDPRSFMINVYDYHVWYDWYSLRQQILSYLPHKLK